MSLPPYPEQPGQYPPPQGPAMPPPPGYGSAWNAVPPGPAEAVFEVRPMRHTGLLLVWLNQRFTVRGTQAQCEKALSDTQTYNMLLGWWSVGSLVWNPISLVHNRNARTTLRAQAHHARASAAWTAYYGQGTAVAPPPFVPPPVKRHRWWLWLVIPLVVFLVLFLALVVYTLVRGPRAEQSASTNPPYPANLSTPERLLNPGEVAPIVGATSLADVKNGDPSKMYADAIVDNDCVGVRFVATDAFYAGVPWMSVKRNYLRDPPEGDVRFLVEQGVVRYRSDDRARQFYTAATDVWNRCAGRTINARQLSGTDTEDRFWTVGPVAAVGDTLTTTLSIPDVAGYACQHALRLRANQIFDVEACGRDLAPDASRRLLDELGARNP